MVHYITRYVHTAWDVRTGKMQQFAFMGFVDLHNTYFEYFMLALS
jgi:hypothetical protein